MIEFLLEIIVEFAFEFLFGLLFEFLAEYGISILTRPLARRRPLGFLGTVIWYIVMGVILGCLSAAFIPGHLNVSENVRIAGRILSPFLMGFALCFFSWYIVYRDIGGRFFRWDKFIGGFLFGGLYSLTRYLTLGI